MSVQFENNQAWSKYTVTLSEAEGSLKMEQDSKDPSASVGMTGF
ncbi:MAG: hypothetical protein RI556_11335 [Hydrogenovibrio sp.]|nr:hypothetical protein [Hydrogenovibrio sp.]MDR9499759.1 hypothetical protein [Hydrogenovibrio sp.]